MILFEKIAKNSFFRNSSSVCCIYALFLLLHLSSIIFEKSDIEKTKVDSPAFDVIKRYTDSVQRMNIHMEEKAYNIFSATCIGNSILSKA